MSAINVNSITGRTGSHGPVLTGVTTVSGSNLVVIGAGASIGIGTSAPDAPLHVDTAVDKDTIAIFGSTDETSGSTFQALHIKNDVTSYPALANVSSADILDLRSAGSVQVTIDANNNDTSKHFRVTTNGTGDSATELLRVNENGQVKIGGSTTVAPDADADNLVIDSGDVDSGISILSATTGRIYFGDAGDHEAGSIRYVHTDNSMRFETANTERIRVGSAGSVHIGDNTSNANGHGLLSLTQDASAAFNALVIQQGNTAFTANDGLHIGIDASVDSYIKTFENRDIYFTTGVTNAERFRINHDGNVNITDGNLVVASGHGIDFSASATDGPNVDSELLDDYEEGTFEPTFTSTSGDFTSVTYHTDTGARYVKVGSLVTVNGCARCSAIDTSNRSGSLTLCIGGLPFTNVARDNGDNADNIGSLRVPVWGNTNNCPHAIQARQNQTFCSLLNYEIDNITNTNIVSQANDSMMVQFSLQYSAA